VLTIAETVVRNRERRRRALQAQKEGKAVAQIIAEEDHDRLARMVADSLAPVMSSVQPSAPVVAAEPPPPSDGDPRWQHLEHEVARIAGQIDSIGRELASFKELLGRAASSPVHAPPAAELVHAGPSAPPRAEDAPPPPPREAPGTGKVPIGDIAAMIDHIQQQYYR
jgi:hypothetical protein